MGFTSIPSGGSMAAADILTAVKTVDGSGSGLDADTIDGVELASLVRDTGDETIAGIKTFSSSPIVPAPTTDMQASTKKYVDDEIAGVGGGSSAPTGSRLTGYWSSAPSGYVLANGSTIGNASSGGTGRANADTSDLFTLLWTNLSDSLAPVSGGRGASAAADFAANKTITLPDERLRVPVMARSGTNLAGVDGVLGATGGEETHALTEAELAAHTHTGPSHTHDGVPTGGTAQRPASIGVTNGGDNNAAQDEGTNYSLTLTGNGNTGSSGTGNTGSTGSGNAHNNVQPFIAVMVAIKL